jgi:hypothetical protein
MICAAIRAEQRAKKWKALLADGPAGQLAPIEEELLCFVFEKCKQGTNGRMTGLMTCCSTARRRKKEKEEESGDNENSEDKGYGNCGERGDMAGAGGVAYFLLLN